MQEASSRAQFRVAGRRPLEGEIRPQGNKNEALPCLAACCLTDQPVILENVPEIEDVEVMAQILRRVGIEAEPGPDAGCWRIRAGAAPAAELPADLVSQLRGAVTLAGPLLARRGRVLLPRPGGDRIGRRRLDTHMTALQALGADIRQAPAGFELRTDGLKGSDILLEEASVTATENAVCAAAVAKGETILRNAASEPHVQGVCRMLNAMGARIEGIGTNVLRIQGVEALGGARHTVGPDYLEVGSFIALAAVTKGELLIRGVHFEDLRMIRSVFSRLGINTLNWGDDLFVPAGQALEIVSDWGGAIPKIDDAPWPGFPADLTSVALVTATQCRGPILIHEKLFESRLFFVDSLISMGARIILCDPHRAVVLGPDPLRGARLSSPDIRAGMALLIAALCADGESIIQNVIQIDRGFGRIDERLRTLGAQIERIQ
ncbi:MAG TPA: UDP-N-acetylglucosamine 1-carboxyvinyltransferase [Candidatus Paceibacterota bacterium]|nr:UDP-N-acetylglucosamine 1-carboxyvinyltransferase [Verrucomicrobiota bacterium]HRZ47279.1 UDP-N-acetylglucosamine 1-carboxyvinyltransferase [Candidatus Paceibacterota bacterium]HRZ93865.1 UDP-N-acetylglucosamine 1-carboxyvinyltransferase [Candidatus Paceibacterota bacterium]